MLLGPSGCGKTTLLRMIAGLEQPTSGDVLIGGHVVNGLPPRARQIAMVFQSYALYPHKTVCDNIAFPLKAAGMAKAERETQGPLGGGAAGYRHAAATASRASSPAASGSGWRWRGRWSASRRCSCSTSRCPTSTPSCAPRRGTS